MKKGEVSTFWTDERVETMRDMWAAGFSASQVAEKIGASRGAVIGKVTRLGLRRSEAYSPVGRAEAGLTKPIIRTLGVKRKPRPERRTKPRPKLRIVGAAVMVEADYDEPKVAVNYRLFEPIEGSEPAPFMSKGCKWPVGGEGVDMLCCGRERKPDKPYCADHCKAAFVPITPEQKRLAKYALRLADLSRKYVA